MLEDVVLVRCGDSNLTRGIFDCSSVQVTSSSGAIVEPLTYSAAVNNYSNALGHKWSVNEVLALYLTVPRQGGFTVRFSNTRGMQWTHVVTPDEAWTGLLLGLQPKK